MSQHRSSTRISKRSRRISLSTSARLRAENDYLKNLQALVLEKSDVSAKNAGSSKAKTKTFTEKKILLSIAQLARATFYYHLKKTNKSDKYELIKVHITTIYHENKGRYG